MYEEAVLDADFSYTTRLMTWLEAGPRAESKSEHLRRAHWAVVGARCRSAGVPIAGRSSRKTVGWRCIAAGAVEDNVAHFHSKAVDK